jgi:hypothetical protein
VSSAREILRSGLCLGALALFLVGCGSSGGSQGSGTPSTPQSLLVTPSKIQEAGPRTPTGVLLAWWQALQFEDARSAIKFYAPKVTTSSRIAAQLNVSGAPTLAMPEVEQTHLSRKRARLYAVIVAATVTKKDQIDTITRRPVTLRMVNRDGKWLFADNNFLAERAAAALAFKGASE